MKSKRIFGWMLAMCLVFALCFTSAPMLAKAKTLEIEKITGYSYSLDYLLEEAGYEALTEGKKVSEGREVSYVEKGSSSEPTKATSTVEFFKAGTYEFTVTKTEGSVQEGTFEVVAVSSIEDSGLKYNLTNADELVKIQQDINKFVKDFKGGDTFDITKIDDTSSLKNIVECEYFSYDDLSVTLYYCTPGSTAYTSTSSKTFKVSNAGIYSFYVTYKTPLGDSIDVSNLVEGPNGLYEEDENGERVGDVIVPIFTFEISDNKAPEIAIGASEDAYLNLEYEVECFTITANDYSAVYELLFSQTYVDKEAYATDSEYISAVEALNPSDVTEDIFDTDALTFTPTEKGYYYVKLKVVDGNNMSEVVISRAIACQDEFIEIKPVKQFIKYNLTTIICLGISAACLIAIIVIAFIKPKEKEVVLETK